MEKKHPGLEKKIIKYGYEYTLVEVYRPEGWKLKAPCFMGFPNMALKSVKKNK